MGINEFYNLAKEKERKTTDFTHIRFLKGKDYKVLIDREDMKRRRKSI